MKEKTGEAYIQELIKEGEHQQQDFKFEISDVCKIAKSLSAFANTDGGRLLIGVKDNGKIAGVRSEGKQVLLATILQSERRPVCAKSEDGKLLAYIRIADENILATPVHLRYWQQSESQCGELTVYTEKEQHLLSLLNEHRMLTLNKCCKLSKLPRPITIKLLARFIRYGIVEAVYKEQQFYFTQRNS